MCKGARESATKCEQAGLWVPKSAKRSQNGGKTEANWNPKLDQNRGNMAKICRLVRNFCLGTPDWYFEGFGWNPKILTFSVFRLKYPSVGQVIPKLLAENVGNFINVQNLRAGYFWIGPFRICENEFSNISDREIHWSPILEISQIFKIFGK